MATPPDFTTGAVLTAAQMNAVGLWKIASSNVGTTSTFTINNCFSSDYNHYLLSFENIKCNTGTTFILFQFVVGGSPSITQYYDSRIDVPISGSVSVAGQSNGAAGNFAVVIDSTNPSGGTVDIFNPATAVNSTYRGGGIDARLAGAPYRAGGGVHNVATAYDGIKFSLLSGNNFATGSVTIYGYKK